MNHAHIQNPTELQSLWQRPLLRSSHTIDGIFHRGVVVCEADADARFYEALLTCLEAARVINEPPDLHFVHGGGKSELSTLAGSYNTLHVPVVVIADFDLLRNENDLQRVINSVGGDWTEVESNFRIASSALAQFPPLLSEEEALTKAEQVIQEIRNRSQQNGQNRITNKDRENITNALDDAKNWSEAKRYGIRKLGGEQRRAGDRLLSQLENIGVFLVPNGEMESWNESLTIGKKATWIREALECITQQPDSFHDAKEFMTRIVRFLGLAQ